MSVRFSSFLALLSCASAPAQESSDVVVRPLGPPADVTVQVVSTFGRPVPGARLRVRERWTGRDYSGCFTDGRCRALPYGTYTVEVRRDGFIDVVLTEELRGPSLLLTVGLLLSPIEGSVGLTRVHGRVLRLPQDLRSPRCRLSGVYYRASHDAALGPDGEFDFGFLPMAAYTLHCMDGPRWLGAALVEAVGGRTDYAVRLAGGGARQTVYAGE